MDSDALLRRLDSLERCLRRELDGLREELAALRREVREEARAAWFSRTLLQFTVTLGFVVTVIFLVSLLWK